MLKIKEFALEEEDFECLKAINVDIKIVFELGKIILRLEREL